MSLECGFKLVAPRGWNDEDTSSQHDANDGFERGKDFFEVLGIGKVEDGGDTTGGYIVSMAELDFGEGVEAFSRQRQKRL